MSPLTNVSLVIFAMIIYAWVLRTCFEYGKKTSYSEFFEAGVVTIEEEQSSKAMLSGSIDDNSEKVVEEIQKLSKKVDDKFRDLNNNFDLLKYKVQTVASEVTRKLK